MNMMNRILKLCLDDFMVEFVDNILIYYKTRKDNEQHLRTALQLLRENKLYAKSSKCEF